MPIEREIKILGADFAALRGTLQALGADCQGPRFESNVLLDDEARSLRASGRLLRLRRHGPAPAEMPGRAPGKAPGRALLTFKEPASGGEAPEGRARHKVLREVQTVVDDPEAVLGILAGLGLTPTLAYEKFREVWRLDGCEVCLDRLPFGDFVELEGPAEALDGLAARLGLDGLETSDASYHALNARHRERLGLPPEDGFAFTGARREALARELGVSLAGH